MVFELPKLLYSYEALEPYIDKETMIIHHKKHHQKYLDNLLIGLNNSSYKIVTIGKLLCEVQACGKEKNILNNGGGYYNHTLFWYCLSPESNESDINMNLKNQIISDFGSLESFKKKFEKAGAELFGSGWVWIVYKDQHLHIVTTKDQDIPMFDGYYPVMNFDVWEHAYYLKYKNDRISYLKNFWYVVDWKNVSLFYSEFASKSRSVEFLYDGSIDF